MREYEVEVKHIRENPYPRAEPLPKGPKPTRKGTVRDPSVYEQDLNEAVLGVPESKRPSRQSL